MSARLNQAFAGLSTKVQRKKHMVRMSAGILPGLPDTPNQSVLQKGAWKHDMQQPHKTARDPKDPSQMRRMQESSYNCLIQTNKGSKLDGDTELTARAMKSIFDDIKANRDNVWYSFFKTGEAAGMTEYQSDINNIDKWIENIYINHGADKITVESNGVKKRMHAHFILTIKHWTNLQIDFAQARVIITDKWNTFMKAQNRGLGTDKKLTFDANETTGHMPRMVTFFNLIPEMAAHQYLVEYGQKERKGKSNPITVGYRPNRKSRKRYPNYEYKKDKNKKSSATYNEANRVPMPQGGKRNREVHLGQIFGF